MTVRVWLPRGYSDPDNAGDGEYALFAHLQHYSIRVRLRQKVKRGEVIALVGNSGNSTGAHLHFQLMDRSASLASEGIPFVFDRFRFLGFGRDFEEDRHPGEPRHPEMTIDDEVIGVP
jgi:murein DD-endopeptidase MepM/ murein hydrolase activator NlpD